jgi:hypothetical protein
VLAAVGDGLVDFVFSLEVPGQDLVALNASLDAKERERAAAGRLPAVAVLTLPRFCELLRWGVVGGVDDGCEPTREEAVAAVTEGRPPR